MAKPQRQPPETDHRRDRVQRSAHAKRPEDGAAAPAPLAGINAKVARWKAAHIAAARADVELKRVREDVKGALVGAGVLHAVTPTGTVALQERAGSTKTDWEALARKHVLPEILETEELAFTTVGEPSMVLAAPKEWTVEAKASAG